MILYKPDKLLIFYDKYFYKLKCQKINFIDIFLSYLTKSLVSEKKLKRLRWLSNYFKCNNSYDIVDPIKELIDECEVSDITRPEIVIGYSRESRSKFVSAFTEIISIKKSIKNI